MNLYNLIENHWYKNKNFLLTILLLPISGIFLFISRIRYYLYKFNILKSHKLPVPVVIVGNISVGGVGKTPLTKMLAIELEQCGINVGIILRGYKSKVKKPSIITPSMSSDLTGDEALIYANSNLKVAIGSDRYLAGLKLLSKYPEIKLIISDDGLQHYKLQRDFEIAVIDGNRLFGNQFVLPMGPLRESVTRLKLVDAIVITQNTLLTKKLNNYQTKLYYQNIKFNKIYNPITKEVVNPEWFRNKLVCIMAAIGNPNRFLNLINNLKIQYSRTLIFPDHYQYTKNDIPLNTNVLVTEKDYTKLKQFNHPNIWIVDVRAELDNSELISKIKSLIK